MSLLQNVSQYAMYPNSPSIKSPGVSPALAKDLILNWCMVPQEETPTENAPVKIVTKNRAYSFNTKKRPIATPKSNKLPTQKSFKVYTKRIAGSILVENVCQSSCNGTSIGSFSSEIYQKIENFLDIEGLDITQAETKPEGFRPIFKLRVEEASEQESQSENPDNLEELSLLTTVKNVSTPLMMMSPDLGSSTLKKRRASLQRMRGFSENNMTIQPSRFAGEFFNGVEEYEEIQSARKIPLKKKKSSYEELSCVDSCDEQSMESPVKKGEGYFTGRCSLTRQLMQGFEKIVVPGETTSIPFIPDQRESPLKIKTGYFSPRSESCRKKFEDLSPGLITGAKNS